MNDWVFLLLVVLDGTVGRGGAVARSPSGTVGRLGNTVGRLTRDTTVPGLRHEAEAGSLACLARLVNGAA